MRKFLEAKRLRPHKLCGLMLEVRGREIRTSEVENKEGILLKPGQQMVIDCVSPNNMSTNKEIFCNYQDLPRAVRPNDIIYIDDGKIICLVTDITTKGINIEIKGGGYLKSRRSIKLPGGKHEKMPILHALDQADLFNIAIKQSNYSQK